MKIRLTRFNLSSSPSKLALLIAVAGQGRISIEARTDSYQIKKIYMNKFFTSIIHLFIGASRCLVYQEMVAQEKMNEKS
jgi:hypothetical protein